MSLVAAHQDDPDVKFSRPFLAGVLTLCAEEAVMLLSEIVLLSIPRSNSTQSPAITKQSTIILFLNVAKLHQQNKALKSIEAEKQKKN